MSLLQDVKFGLGQEGDTDLGLWPISQHFPFLIKTKVNSLVHQGEVMFGFSPHYKMGFVLPKNRKETLI